MSKSKVIELALLEAGYVEGANNLNKFAPIAGGSGGSGIVIVRYLKTEVA